MRGVEQPVPSPGAKAPGPAKGSDTAAKLVRIARSALENGDPQAAAPLLERAVAMNPERVDAAVLYGRALLKLQRPTDAAEVFRHALTLDPTSRDAAVGYAKAMLALDRPEVATDHLRAVLAHGGKTPGLLNLLGVSLDLQGRHEEAVRTYRQALEISPGNRAVTNNLALALAFAGRFDEAISTLAPIAEKIDSDRRSRQNLALIYGLKGDLAAARRLMRIDLDDEAIANNLRYFETLRALGPGPEGMANLAPRPAKPEEKPIDPPDRGVAVDRLVALRKADLADGRLAVGDWFLRIGMFPDRGAAEARFRSLRSRFPEALRGLVRLSSSEPGPQPLLIGPVADRGEAQRICHTLEKAGESCDPLRL